MRRELAESLATLGHRVLEAPDARRGIETAALHRPQLVIVDFAMPRMNGAEAARALRADAPDLPILIASGYADTDAIAELGGRAVALLHKPFRIEALQAAVDDALNGAA